MYHMIRQTLSSTPPALAGHSKWANTRHRKADVDKKRGSLLTRMAKEIMAAVKEGGGDPEENAHLAAIITRAKAASVPKANIASAIEAALNKDASGTHAIYEGQLGPVALLVHTLTDNKNRTTARVRHCLTKHGGSLAGAGSASWLFTRRVLYEISLPSPSEDVVESLMDVALGSGADDVELGESDGSDGVVVVVEPASSKALGAALKEWATSMVPPPVVDVSMVTVPDNMVDVSHDEAKRLNAVLDMFQDEDDVVDVDHNADLDNHSQ